ncbi:hypothetical protein ABIA33_003984 [Streptacidiphilus sp. MAP12-16]|uniref:hypothetical protein n=1 Tax=Streptacidiphilus sp. MAP12-16 TaxID=3156300 RepID=UPI003519A9CB
MSASMSFHADAESRVTCHTYGTDTPPILALDGPGHSLMISAFDKVPLSDHLTFARSLVDAITEYMAALEIYAAAHTASAKAG